MAERLISLNFFGDKQLAANIESIRESVQKKIMRKAIKRGATPMAQAVADAAPVETGALRSSVEAKMTRKGGVMIWINPKMTHVGPDGKLRRPAKYAHLVEFGTKQLTARPFFRATVEKHKPVVMKAIEAEARIELNRAEAKLRTGV